MLPVDSAVSQFTALDTLHLVDDSTFTDDIFDELVMLPLTTVHIECEDISAVGLLDLVAGSATLQSLHLHLSPMFDFEYGETIDDWRLPLWTERFDFEDAQELLIQAGEYGVEICEQLVEALECEYLFEDLLHPKKGAEEAPNTKLTVS